MTSTLWPIVAKVDLLLNVLFIKLFAYITLLHTLYQIKIIFSIKTTKMIPIIKRA